MNADGRTDTDGDRVSTDVVVVGAGPAGCFLSYLLARSGVDVTLLERHGDLDREFRGYGFQPLVLDLFEQAGLLDDILALDHAEVRRPSVLVFGREYPVFDLHNLPARHRFFLLMEQPPLLELLVRRADQYPSFTYRDRTVVTDLQSDDGRVVGVEATDRETGDDVRVESRLVVAADGRFSTVRSAAGIDAGRLDSDIELLWFKLPPDAVSGVAQARLDAGGLLLYFGLGATEAQAGWFVEKGGYPALREAGIERFHERLLAVDPSLNGVIQEAVPSFDACSLLHIEPGLSEDWVRDGLALVGDAAHVASPIGAQGNALAIQDATVLHRVVTPALDDAGGPLPKSTLRRYAETRRPAVERVIGLQRRAERGLTALVRHWNDVPMPARKLSMRALFAVAPHLPQAKRTRDLMTLGPDDVYVETSLFEK